MQPNAQPVKSIEDSFNELARFDLCRRQTPQIKPTVEELSVYTAAVESLHQRIAAQPELAARLTAYATQFNSHGAINALRGNMDQAALQTAAQALKKHVSGETECPNPDLPLLLAGSSNADYQRLLIQAAEGKSKFASSPLGTELRKKALIALGQAGAPDAEQVLFKTMLTDRSLRETAKGVLRESASDALREQCLKLAAMPPRDASWEVAAVANDTSQARKMIDWVRLNSVGGGELRAVINAAKEVGESGAGSANT